MLKNKDQEQLESYVLGDLSKKEEEIIENRLLTDSDLKKEYEYLLLLNKALLDKADLQEKMSFLKRISFKNNSVFVKYRQVFYIAASILLIAGIGGVISFNKGDNILKDSDWTSPASSETGNPYGENENRNIQDTNKVDSNRLEYKEKPLP